MSKKYPLTVCDIPDSLLMCRFVENQEINYSIEEMSPKHVVLRMTKEAREENGRISFCCFDFQADGYVCHEPFDGKIVDVSIREFDKAVCFEIASDRYANMVDIFCKQYQNYIRIKLESTDNSFSKELTGYPAEKDTEFSASYEEWVDETGIREKLESVINELVAENPKLDMAVELDNHIKYKRFLDEGTVNNTISRLYVGNAYCRRLFPDPATLKEVCDKAHDYKLKITYVMPLMEDGFQEEADKNLDAVFETSNGFGEIPEIEINDWGMLRLLQRRADQGAACHILYGSLLDKRRKDPRYPYKWGWEQMTEKKDNSLSDSRYLSFLNQNGIDRFELEACGYEIGIPAGKSSLHIPFYQTNTSQYCPLLALCKYGDRGHQKPETDCERYCENVALMYPKHLSVAGKYNSIFALDIWTLENIDILKKYINKGVDRLVINL